MKSINEHFNLRYSPFADTYSISTPYLSKSEAADIERMLMLIGEGKSFSIAGEPGSGKSMLLRTLVSKFDGKAFRCAQVAYSGQKPGAVLRDICDQLRIDAAGRGSLLARLRKSFARSSENPFAVIVLDEAQDLPMESMFELFSLTHDTHERTAAASVVLCGHPILEKRLSLDSFASVKSRLSCRFRTRPLDEDGTKDFIAHRLKLVKAPKDVFHEDALRLITIDGKGNRRSIMNLAGNCLQYAAARGENVVTADIAYEVCNEMK
jgi:type II secretory pathway predicted ATPase ExeA